MPSVNISLQDDSLKIVPWKVRIGGAGDLKIKWTLAAAGGWEFSTDPPGIVCEMNPGSLFAPWDGTTAQTDGPAGHYEATGAPANERKRYKYSIHLMKGGERLDIDPEIMNDPPTT